MGAALSVADDVKIDHLRRWTPAVVLSPLLPCMYALLIIFTGEIVVNIYSTDCVKALGAFVKGAVGLSYALLLTFAWVFMGFSVTLPWRDNKVIELVTPFVQLKSLARTYLVILACAFAWWCLGTALIFGASTCRKTSPVLWAYTWSLLFTFWPMFLLGLAYLVRMENKDRRIRNSLLKSEDVPKLDADEKILKAKFEEFDEDGSGHIEGAELGALLSSMGIELSEQELGATMGLLDEGGDGNISFKELLKWYRMSPLERRQWMKKVKGGVTGGSRVRGEGEGGAASSATATGGGSGDDDEEEEEEDDG